MVLNQTKKPNLALTRPAPDTNHITLTQTRTSSIPERDLRWI